MNKKSYILDCISSGNQYGECETQIIEYFHMINIAISREELKNILTEMLDNNLISINQTWTNENNEMPYVITSKGEKILEDL